MTEKKRPGRSIMKNTPEDEAVARGALENAGKRLLELVDQIEAKIDIIAGHREDMKSLFAAAKSDGYSTAEIKRVIKRRAATPEALKAADELELVIDGYMEALRVAE